jgi:hypothetical protein
LRSSTEGEPQVATRPSSDGFTVLQRDDISYDVCFPPTLSGSCSSLVSWRKRDLFWCQCAHVFVKLIAAFGAGCSGALAALSGRGADGSIPSDGLQ